jgi:hypothetical protein
MKRQFVFIISKESKNIMTIENFVETVKLRAVGVKAQEIGPKNLTEEIVKDIAEKCEKGIAEAAENFVPRFTMDDHHYISLEIEI